MMDLFEYSYVNLLGQIAKTENENAKTWYSYDEFGQLLWTSQYINDLATTKTVSYTYDYFGNVKQVAYQTGSNPDKFYHHYDYDIDQRLTKAYTSFDGTNKTLKASYYYYLHGPLKRVELGDPANGGIVQGIDYVYNIDGSLKLINHPDPNLDPASMVSVVRMQA